MSWPESPPDLLAGPRGRRLCWELTGVYGPAGIRPGLPGWHNVMFGGQASRDQLAAELRGRIASLDLGAIRVLSAASALLAPLAEAVDAARYWQEPDEVDAALADDGVSAALAPVAAAVIAAPASSWWASPLDRRSQAHVRFLSAGGSEQTEPLLLRGAAGRLAAWRAKTIADELRAATELPADPAATYSGQWWSAPSAVGLVVTTRSLPALGALRLALAEDSLDWTGALCWRVVPETAARVYEIREPADWSSLVDRYPLEVTYSRRHDWWRATGWDGRWLIPDFAAIAADCDAVHLTVGGYLSTAGRALPVGDACTMVAGWDPDAAYWLTDVLAGAGGPVRWKTAPDLAPFRWAAVAPEA